MQDMLGRQMRDCGMLGKKWGLLKKGTQSPTQGQHCIGCGHADWGG